jgi:hypothetical protein
MNEFDFSPEEAASLVPDAIRHTFQCREARCAEGVRTDIERLKDQGFELDKLKNSWSDEQYKGINSQWIDPDSGQRFEAQFDTRISFEPSNSLLVPTNGFASTRPISSSRWCWRRSRRKSPPRRRLRSAPTAFPTTRRGADAR